MLNSSKYFVNHESDQLTVFSYFQEIVSLGEEAHLNTSFKHFVYFIQEFELIDKKELAPLQELIDRLTSGQSPE